jgi:ATP-binding cassette subfamily B multidrug efflux pump
MSSSEKMVAADTTDSPDQTVKMLPALGHLLSYAKRYGVRITIAIVCALIGAGLNLAGPSRLGDISNLLLAGVKKSSRMDLAAIGRIGLALVVIYALGFLFNYAQGWLMADITQRLTRDMRADLTAKIDRLPLSYLDSTPQGDTLSRMTNDVDSVGQSLGQSVSQLVSGVAQILGAAVIMFATNWQMALSGIVSALVGMVFSLLIIRRSQPYFADQQRALGAVNAQVEEVMGGLDVVTVMNGAAGENKRFRTRNTRLYDAAWKSAFLSGIMTPLMIFIGNIAYVVVCIVGGALALAGTISFGTVIAFMVYIRLFTQPLQTIAQAATSMQTMTAASGRVFDFLALPEMEDESAKTAVFGNVRGDVVFDHVRFGYSPEREIIHDFCAHIRPGQKAAIVGPTGAGKTTLVNLLMRFYEVNDGAIRLDGRRTADTTRANLHDQFGMVLQDTWFFQGTLRENIAFDTPGVTDAMLDRACEACGLGGYVRSLPHGYDTRLEPSSISAGQRQLITIARAMIKDAPLLILDEATSNVDTRTELQVQKAMDALSRGRTSFVIAHRLSTIRNADIILYMEHGDVLETGTHEQLLRKGGRYARLYNSQFDRQEG